MNYLWWKTSSWCQANHIKLLFPHVKHNRQSWKYFSVTICHAENVWLFWLLFWSKINISSPGPGAEGCGWLTGVLDSNYFQFCDMFGINNSMQIGGADVGCRGVVNPPPPSQSSPPPQAIFMMASRKIIISWFPPLAGPNHHIGQHTRHHSLLLFLFISLVNDQ